MWNNVSEVKKENNQIATQFVLAVEGIYILLGALLLFVPQIQILTLCYFICAVLVISGIIMIVRYFITDAFKNINEYGFSVGVFMVILGMCALVRVDGVAASFVLCLGIALLMTSVVKLQNALDLKKLGQKTWIFMLGLAFIFMVCSILIIINPFSKPQTLPEFTYRILMIDGIVSLFSNVYLYFIIKNSNKREKVNDVEEGGRKSTDTELENNEEQTQQQDDL